MTALMLVTGMTGNVGRFVAERLIRRGAAVRGAVPNVDRAQRQGADGAELVRFDFLEAGTYDRALEGITSLFLMRPPLLTDPKPMLPFVQRAKERGVKHIVFLSLHGIERNPLAPHYRIEKYVRNSGIPYTFLRSGFFMQHLNTVHRQDIVQRSELFVPAGKAPVSFVDARDIGEAAAAALTAPSQYAGRICTLTGAEALTCDEAAAILSRELGRPIAYTNPAAGEFRRELLCRGVPRELVDTLIALYFTAKLGLARRVTVELEAMIGRRPGTLEQYVRDYADCWR